MSSSATSVVKQPPRRGERDLVRAIARQGGGKTSEGIPGFFGHGCYPPPFPHPPPSSHIIQFAGKPAFGQRTRRGRCPIGQRGEFSVHPSERTSERTNERTSVRTSPEGPAPPPDPSLSALSRPQPPRPLETLPRPQLPCSRPPATPPFPQALSFLREPLPPTDGRKIHPSVL